MFCVYYLVATENRASAKDSLVLLTIMASQVIASLQLLGVFDILLVIWPEPFATVLKLGNLLNLDMEALNVNCVVSHTELVKYVGTLFGFVVLLATIAVVHVLFVLIVHGGRFRERWESRGVAESHRKLCPHPIPGPSPTPSQRHPRHP